MTGKDRLILENIVGGILLKENDTMSLNDIYGDIEYDVPEDEALYHAVDPELGDVQLPIIELSVEKLLQLTTYQDDTTVFRAYKDFADSEQKKIVKPYTKNTDELHENPVVINNNTALDGYHRIVAAILTKQPLKALDISDI
jgi:hypothetical protein